MKDGYFNNIINEGLESSSITAAHDETERLLRVTVGSESSLLAGGPGTRTSWTFCPN